MEEDKLEYYLSIGAIEVVGVDESGEMIFSMTEECKDLAPELWEAHQQHVDETLIQLLEKGLINVTYNEDLQAIIEISEEGKEEIKKMGLIEFPYNEKDIPNN
jgi:DNA-binding PadR family transcriptional regulator